MKIDTDKFWKLQLVIRPACSQELLELLGTQAPPPETEQQKRKKQRARKKVNSHLIFMKKLTSPTINTAICDYLRRPSSLVSQHEDR